ncbi:hypothetical protein ACKI1I_17450 [Streptomyces turgidiscabies]|uniref:hypothetical protein n=1 Tax=Streptomyces TaxID=1883 RepID=UPI0006B326D6|nr:hypothetical protein [Streptomyces sp. NRRL B-24085]
MTAPTCDDTLTAEDIHRAVHSLCQLTAHLHTSPHPAEAAVLLGPLLDADHGLITRLALPLREVSRLLAQHAAVPWDRTVASLVGEYFDAADAVDQLRQPLHNALRALEPRTGHGQGSGSGVCQ